MNFTNEQVEKQVLSGMMLSAEDRLSAFAIIPTTEIFLNPQNKLIARAIEAQQLAGEEVDLMTVVATLKRSGLLKDAGGSAYVAKVFASLESLGKIEIHCRILIEQYLKHRTFLIAHQMLQGAQSDQMDIFDHLAKIQFQADKLLSEAIVKDDDNFSASVEETEKSWLNKSDKAIAGYSTGIGRLDAICGGFTNGELTVIGARPGQGKSALVVSLVRNLAKQGIGCGLFSLEMSKHELIQRLAAQESQIFAFKIKQGHLNELDKSSLRSAVQSMKAWPVKIFDSGAMDIRKLKTRATMWKRKYGIQVIFIDYLQLMDSSNPKETNRVNVISEISRGLKILARELNMPVIALSQLSRRVDERPDKMPQLSDLRESGSIEQDADVVWMMMRPAYYGKEGTTKIGDREFYNEDLCIIDQCKMRSGSTGIIPLKFDAPLMRLRDYD
jgi:replicative DNA helicase